MDRKSLGAANAGAMADGNPDGTSAQKQGLGSNVVAIPTNRQPRRLGRCPAPREGEVIVLPLGGLGRIGMNWTLYGNSGRWLLVDAGIGFPDDEKAGVDALIPDPADLGYILERVDGLVVTHAHEDHIGAIDRIVPNVLDCPIYATPFASAVISRRLDEIGTLRNVDIRTFEVGSSFEVGPFSVRSIRMTHSSPEPVSLAISTDAGTVLHTGDWKLDPDPLLGLPTDVEALRDLGDVGLLAMVCDSTNADRDLPITSEAQIRESFTRIMRARKGTVVVSCFASNVARVASAAIAASRTGRQVALAGRSMRNNEAIADSLGMMSDVPDILAEPSHLRGLDRREIALVCTGTQGEERAALSRLARGDSRLPQLEAGDTLVLSARTIPGNEEDVERVLSKLRKRGVEILTAKDTFDGMPIHVSGHAGQRELRELHAMARPRFVLPVHGEDRHLAAHAAIAIEQGALAAPIGREGEVFAISQRGMRSLGCIPVRLLELRNDREGNKVPLAAPARKIARTAAEVAPAPRR
jgi:ribonuclease J